MRATTPYALLATMIYLSVLIVVVLLSVSLFDVMLATIFSGAGYFAGVVSTLRKVEILREMGVLE